MKTKSLANLIIPPLICLFILLVIIPACSIRPLNSNNKTSSITVSDIKAQKTFLSKEELTGLDKENSQFNVKSLTKAYLFSKLKKWQADSGVNGEGQEE